MRLLPSGLMARFIILAGVVLCAGMIGIGFWVGAQVERIVTDNAGATTALYVDSMVSPAVQTMGASGHLANADAEQLAATLGQGALSRQVSAFKLWSPQGRIVYSDRPERIGHFAPDNPRLAVALSGEVNAELRNVLEPGLMGSQQLMEVYSPVRSNRTGEVIAVAEFYTTTEALRADLLDSRIKSWVAVGCITVAMFLALYAMFAQGHRTIAQQRAALNVQIAELSRLLRQNDALSVRVAQANARIAEQSENTLRRLSADIHDGPAQLMAFAAMRLDGAAGQEQAAGAVNEALEDLRLICRGMMLPELERWSVEDIANRLVGTHESRMNTQVCLTIARDLPELSVAKKNCLYRFLQETLNNSARHAAGAGQSVVIRETTGNVEVEVSDTGPGFDPATEMSGLGLAGLRDRVVGLDGRFNLHTQEGHGTCVTMLLPVKDA
ncbi:sensor histidine kinase [Paracoccus laeviglucosivorans]|uniref:histidine kinase n=1 Tax=Paracoccus laeviglucosivorans TaxID=1197861 RepID=A0A521CYL4_9RHOB|nr:ATP-binding protein [Paracoccus laeviglucosivorans]SMO64537.1 hypothetical protein SAMN06265221_105309 [Paracoccus laeviglucosivorans]